MSCFFQASNSSILISWDGTILRVVAFFSAIFLAVFNVLKVSVLIFFLAVGDEFICEVINEVGDVLVELVKFCVLIIHICNSFCLLFLWYNISVALY